MAARTGEEGECFFFFNDTATTEIYTLSLHDALPIYGAWHRRRGRRGTHKASCILAPGPRRGLRSASRGTDLGRADRKSTRLNSSHANISYAVFCLKKKKHFFLIQSTPIHPFSTSLHR